MKAAPVYNARPPAATTTLLLSALTAMALIASLRSVDWTRAVEKLAEMQHAAAIHGHAHRLPITVEEPFLEDAQVRKIVNFLTADRNTGTSGAAYVASAGALAGKLMPLSFWTLPDYFGRYVCKYTFMDDGTPADCHVTDEFDPNSYAVRPDKTHGGDMQLERLNVHNGVNIYDAAVWQIGLAVCAIKDKSMAGLMEHADNVNSALRLGYSGDDVNPNPAEDSWRGTTKPDGTFLYNGAAINSTGGFTAKEAYAYRMWPRQWMSDDPFMGTEFADYISTLNFPANNPVYIPGRVSWSDYKPITGENSWAFFLGPLQTQYLKDVVQSKQSCVNFYSDAVQSAINVLTSVEALQSRLGGVYYVPRGTLRNVGSEPADPFAVSTENNASLLAGLLMLQKLLATIRENGCRCDGTQLSRALLRMDTIINGGWNHLQGYHTEGLLAFFKRYAYNSDTQLLQSGGFANKPGQDAWVPFVEDAENPQAVDVNTWGIAILGVPFMDTVVGGFGAAYHSWELVKEFGGFYVDGKLLGVGYSADDHNGPAEPSADGVLSGEWTLGAINFVRVLKQQYLDMASDPTQVSAEQAAQIAIMVRQLASDELHMLDGMKELLSDRYASSVALKEHRPPTAESWDDLVGVADDQLAFLYASKRYFIPYGWYANPIPATSSTGWALMVHYDFNPFALGGSYAFHALSHNGKVAA